MMRSLSCVVLLGILHNCIQATNQCSPQYGWEPKEPAERAEAAQIVILGTVIRGPCTADGIAWDTPYSATFRVHCVIKGQSLPDFVNVSGFGAKDGPCPTSTALLNKMYIAFLKGKGSNGISGLSVHEVFSHQATIRVRQRNKTTLREIIHAVGRNVSLPVGTRNTSTAGCPVLEHHATKTSKSRKDHGSHNHMKRRKRCMHKRRRRKQKHRLKSTRRSSTATTLEATFKSTTDSRVSSSPAATSSPTQSDRENPDFEVLTVRGRASHVESSWFLVVLIFHSLVSLVVKYHQT